MAISYAEKAELLQSRPEIVLRDITDADLDLIREMRCDREIQDCLLAHPSERGATDAEEWVQRRLQQGRLWVIADGGDGRAIGFVQLTRQHFVDRYAYFGIALARCEIGKGHGRSAMTALINLARCELKLRKLLLEVRADNARACNLYADLGFRAVGRFLDHYFDGSRLHDVIAMELLLETGGPT